ncbi:putative membrane protein [Yersinia pestis PY-03]|nr:putative membrane protein [Yersinia pestis PY-03]
MFSASISPVILVPLLLMATYLNTAIIILLAYSYQFLYSG